MHHDQYWSESIDFPKFILYAGNNSTKGESVQATLSATLLEKKSTKPLNNNIYFDEEDRAQNQSNTSMGVTIIHEHERWDNSLK